MDKRNTIGEAVSKFSRIKSSLIPGLKPNIIKEITPTQSLLNLTNNSVNDGWHTYMDVS